MRVVDSLFAFIANILTDAGNVVVSNGITTSVPSGTKTNVSSITLTKGTWLVIAQLDLNAVPSGKQYQATITQGSTDIASAQIGTTNSGGLCRQNLCAVVELNATTTLYATMYQNGGSTLTALINKMTAVRLVSVGGV